MAYHGPKVRLSRALGVAICETPKHLNPRKAKRPGMHGWKRARNTLYGRQLVEKQKVAFYYNVADRQLRKYMAEAANNTRDTTEVFQELLERRLDNVIRRLAWARTIWQARQIVAHGHVYINGRKCDRPSYRVGVGDVISIRERSKNFVKVAAETAEVPFSQGWLSYDEQKMEARVDALPTTADIRLPFDVNPTMIVEYYMR